MVGSFQDRVYVMGGYQESDRKVYEERKAAKIPGDTLPVFVEHKNSRYYGSRERFVEFLSDVWVRDAKMPVTVFVATPKHKSTEDYFAFEADEPGCVFEFKIIQLEDKRIVVDWKQSLGSISVEALLADTGSGRYTFMVRAFDPAGNFDTVLEIGRNMYTWTYYAPINWPLILGIIAAVFVLLGGVWFEWRRRRKKAAMERYAIKRMRRKLKGAKTDAKNKEVDWKKHAGDEKSKLKKKKKGK